MHVIDTSLWIEDLVGSALGQKVKIEIAQIEKNVVPTLVQHELFKWLCRNRSREDAENVIAFTMTCQVVPLGTGLALRASDLARKFRLHASDAIIYATALHLGADLLTCDAHFEGLAQVRYMTKRESPA